MRQNLQAKMAVRAALAIAASAVLCLGHATAAEPSTADSPVKKSSSGICHAPGTAYYAQTQRFTAYPTMDACIASGGRYPKGQEPGAGPPVKKSKSGICHDRSSPSYGQTKSFTPYASIEKCLASGGRLPKART